MGSVREVVLSGTVSAAKLSGEVRAASITSVYAMSVDDALSAESENPVQNKVVTAALDSKVAAANAMTNEQVKSLFHS